MSILEKLVGAKALIESAIEEELASRAPPEPRPNAAAPTACEHKNGEEITGAGKGPRRRACVDCGHIWEVE